MLDIKFIRESRKFVEKSIRDRNLKLDLDGMLSLDDKRRKVLLELENLRAQKNKANEKISAMLKEKQDAKPEIDSMKSIAVSIDKLEEELRGYDTELGALLLTVPNVPHTSLPVGDARENKVMHTWGQPKTFDFKPLTHLELCANLDIVDFPRATKLTASNFILYKGWGARLERALINFMLDMHTQKHGYLEIFPPFLVNRKSMTGTGQLPKLEEDMYKLKDDDLFLIPTAEVPVTNIFRDDILEDKDLPIYYTAYTACFRREAGSYGKDTRGLLRVHQFDKVEMVKFVKPESSYFELEKLVKDAEDILQALEIPYRVVMLATGDLSFAASKCFDIEAHAAGVDKWLEVSSCSNFENFQARRANIRYRRPDKVVDFVHTLNGSGVALPRTMAALLENNQQKDGTILIPPALRPYCDGKERIS